MVNNVQVKGQIVFKEFKVYTDNRKKYLEQVLKTIPLTTQMQDLQSVHVGATDQTQGTRCATTVQHHDSSHSTARHDGIDSFFGQQFHVTDLQIHQGSTGQFTWFYFAAFAVLATLFFLFSFEGLEGVVHFGRVVMFGGQEIQFFFSTPQFKGMVIDACGTCNT
jgi:hypothetical protein